MQLKVGGEVRKKLTVGVDLNGPVAMTLRAETQLAEAGLPLDMEVKSKQLYWYRLPARKRIRLTIFC